MPKEQGEDIQSLSPEGEEEKKVSEEKAETSKEGTETLETQLAKAQAEATRWEGAYKGRQREIAEKDTKIQELESRPPSVSRDKEVLELRKDVARLQDVVLSARETDEELEPKPKGKSRLEQLENEIRLESEKEWNQKLRELQGIASSVGKDAYTAPEFQDCRDFFDTGKPDLIEKGLQKARQIAKQLKENEPVKEPEKPKETEDERIERKARELLDKDGLTTQDAGGPSTGKRSFTRAEIDAMPIAEYEKLKPEVDLAHREGRIKD